MFFLLDLLLQTLAALEQRHHIERSDIVLAMVIHETGKPRDFSIRVAQQMLKFHLVHCIVGCHCNLVSRGASILITASPFGSSRRLKPNCRSQ